MEKKLSNKESHQRRPNVLLHNYQRRFSSQAKPPVNGVIIDFRSFSPGDEPHSLILC